MVANGDYLLGAFVGSELRGVANAIQAGEKWIFFLTLYSSTSDEQIQFKVYDPVLQDIVPVRETFTFQPNGVVGDPLHPYQMTSGNIVLTFDTENVVRFEILDTLWKGSERVRYHVRDAMRQHHYSDSDYAIYTIIEDHSPQVKGIPDQIVDQGTPFPVFDLDEYLHEYDGQEVTWGFGYSQHFVVTIDAENRVVVAPRNSEWLGKEAIIFQVRDVSTNGLTGLDTADFTVIKKDHPPIISRTLSQEIPPTQTFTSFLLNDYMSELDGDSVAWSYAFLPASQSDDPPAWSVNPGNYQYTMTMTARVQSLGKIPNHQGNLLAAFSGSEVRGVCSPIRVGDGWLYFLTIYQMGKGGDTVPIL